MANFELKYGPTTSTKGAVGDTCTDTNTGKKYICVKAMEFDTYLNDYGKYEWKEYVEESNSGSNGSANSGAASVTYDIIIDAGQSMYAGGDSPEVITGRYALLKTKILNKEPINGLVIEHIGADTTEDGSPSVGIQAHISDVFYNNYSNTITLGALFSDGASLKYYSVKLDSENALTVVDTTTVK